MVKPYCYWNILYWSS